MRWDIRVTVYALFAGAALAVSLMAAAIRLHFEGVFGAFCLWGGLFLFIILSMAAVREGLLGERRLSTKGHRARVLSLYGMVISGACFLVFMIAYLIFLSFGSDPHIEGKNDATTQVASHKPLTMLQIFNSDFPSISKVFMKFNIETNSKGRTADIIATQYWNSSSNSFFIAIYLYPTENYVAAAESAADCTSRLIEQLSLIEFQVSVPGDNKNISTKNMVFSKKVFLYIDDTLSNAQLSHIETYYSVFGYDATIRTETYRVLHWNDVGRKPVGIDATDNPGAYLANGEHDGDRVRVFNRYTGPSNHTSDVPQAIIDRLNSLPPVPAPPRQPEKK